MMVSNGQMRRAKASASPAGAPIPLYGFRPPVGTPYGLDQFLRIVTGVDGIVVEEPADRQFHLRVRVPPSAAPQLDLIARLVRAEKPAATTCEVVLDDPDSTVIIPTPH